MILKKLHTKRHAFLCLSLNILFLYMLNSCAMSGVMELYDQEGTVRYPEISSRKGKIVRNSCRRCVTDSEMLTQTWGKPDIIKHVSENEELWEYNTGLRWNGLIVFPCFPIALPVAVPVGHRRIEFTVRNSKIVSAATAGNGAKMSYCHLGLTGC